MRRALIWLVVVAAAAVGAPPAAHAQAVPVGPDFTVGGDLDLSHCPVVAVDGARWFVVVFVTYFSWDATACGFSDAGVWQGCQALDEWGIDFRSVRPADIAAVGPDDFLAVWETCSWEPPTDPTWFIRGRRLSAHGVLLSDPFEVASSQVDFPRDPRVAALPASRVVVVWVNDSSEGTDDSGSSIQARLFTIDGAALGPRFQVNTTTLGDQSMPDVAAAPDGRFVVVWESESSAGTDQSGISIQRRRFDADGLPVGNDEQVNTYTDSDQRLPRVACAGDGSFVIVWDSDGSSGDDGSSLSVQARLFEADGTPAGSDVQVNTYTDSTQSAPSVAMMNSGGFEVVWTSDGSPGDDDSSRSIQRQAFAADGGRLGQQLQVNTLIELDQWAPDIAMNADGDFVVVWDDTITGLRGRIYRYPVLADGFESGDTSAWSATVP